MTDSNATNERTISADLPDYPAAVVKFRLLSSVAISGAEVFPILEYSLTLDANGVGTIELPTPDGDGTLAWAWQIVLPDNVKVTTTLAWAAGTLALSTWLAAAASTATPSDLLGQYVQLAGDTMTGLLTLSGAPTASLHAATKAYADSVAGVTPDVDGITTDSGNSGEMLRVDGAGTGLEFRTQVQVLADIGAAASGHDHDADYDALGAAATVAGNLTTHEGDTANPHSVTAAQVSALTLAGGTMAGDIGMADNEITRPVLKDVGETVNALGDLGGGTDDIDLTLGNVVTLTVSTSTQTFTFSNWPASGTAGSVTVIGTNMGSQTIVWPAAVKWAGGTAPTLTAAGVDVLTFTSLDAGTTIYGFSAGLDMS